MGELDEIRKQRNTWSTPIVNAIESLQIVKQRQEASGFQNTWSGLNDVEREIIQLQDITRSGFLTKIAIERSGFALGNNISGIRILQTINRSGFNDLETINTDIRSGVVMLRTGESVVIADGANISGGWFTGTLGCYDRWTLYIATSGTIDVRFELSPDGGTHYFESSDSPLQYVGASEDINEMGYDATNIRITGNSLVGVTCIVRGCY